MAEFDQTAIADESIKPLDISAELYRVYTYPDGKKFKIENPQDLFILANGSHRVIDTAGVCHRPERGYVGISWKQVNGKPFQF